MLAVGREIFLSKTIQEKRVGTMRFNRLLTILLLGACSLCAQETRGMISGTVTDPQSASVAGAAVTITNTDTNVSTRLTTNASGYFEAPLMLAGAYQVSVEAAGFKKAVRSGLNLAMSQQLQANLKLEVGALSESVTVSAESPILDTSTVTTGKVLTQNELMNLPVMTNDVVMMARMAAGVEVQNTTQYATQGMTGASSGFSMALGIGKNEWTMDGAPNSNGSNIAFMPHTDMVDEMKVETSNFDASYGHGTGLSVSFASKSGANQVHGTIAEQYWNVRWNAWPFFVKQNYYLQIAKAHAAGDNALADKLAAQPMGPGGHSHDYGATLTGPVYLPKVYDGRNKLFFYLGISRVYTLQPARPGEINYTVPTDAERGGNFSNLLGISSKYQIYDPLSVRPDPARSTHYIRTPIAGNILPASRIVNPAYDFYNKRLPHANNNPTNPLIEPSNNFLATAMPDNNTYKGYQSRIDYQLTDKQRLFFRWSYSLFYEDAQDWTYATERGFHSWDDYRRNQMGLVDWSYAISPTTLLGVTVSANTFYDRQFHNVMMSYKPSDVGLPAYMDTKCAALNGCAVPRMLWNGYSDLGWGVSPYVRQTQSSLKANFSQVRGSHSIRAGIDFRQSFQTRQSGAGDSSGNFNFNSNYTRKDDDGNAANGSYGLSWAAFMMGIPSSMSIDDASGYAVLTPYYGAYVQDTWRVTRHLTITPGLRFEYEAGPSERYNQAITAFDPNAQLPIAAAAKAAYAQSPLTQVPASSFVVQGGQLYAGTGTAPHSWWPGELMVLPRFSAAWQFSPRMILRGGYGIYYDANGASSPDQFGYSRTTSTTLTNDFGMHWLAGDPQNGISPLKDPFPIRSDGTRFDKPIGNILGTSAYLGRGIGWQVCVEGSEDISGCNDRLHSRVQRWRIGVQRQLSANMMVEGAYWGQYGDHLSVSQNLKTLPQQYWATGMVRNNAIASDLNSNVTNPFYIANFASLATSNPELYQQMSTLSFFTSKTMQKNQLLRAAYPQYSSVSAGRYIGKALSHSLELNFQRRMSKGFNLNASYTRAMGERWSTITNEFDLVPTAWLPSNSPISHRFVATAIYEFPFGKGRAFLKNGGILSRFVGGWQTALSYEYQPGPFVSWGNNFYYGDFNTLAEDLVDRTKSLDRWFNTDVPFEKTSSKQPAAYHVRVFPQDITSVRADGVNLWNGNIRRNFQLKERLRLEFRVDALNLQNRSQMNGPDTNPNNTTFGKVTSQTSSVNRFYQLQARIQF